VSTESLHATGGQADDGRAGRPAVVRSPQANQPAHSVPGSLAPTPDPSQPVIALDHLSVNLGGRPILHDLSVALTGRAIGLLGPNGAGKTTLIHTLLGFHPPASGTARIFGLDIRSHARQVRTGVGYMPENDSFIADQNAVRFVRMMGELSGLPAEAALERAHEALFYVGLGEARYRTLGTYSLGMKQRAKLAQALVHGPQLLFLDEPTNGLDPPARARMIKLIQEIRDSGHVRIILSSHLLRDVEECCEQVLILKSGRLAAYRDLAAERSANLRFLELEIRGDEAAEADFAGRLTDLGCEVGLHGRRRLRTVLPAGVDSTAIFGLAAQARVQVRRLDVRRDSLEDIFLRAMENGDSGAPGQTGGGDGRP
jgi:ABC-2 type transport system ATP-binding protein